MLRQRVPAEGSTSICTLISKVTVSPARKGLSAGGDRETMWMSSLASAGFGFHANKISPMTRSSFII